MALAFASQPPFSLMPRFHLWACMKSSAGATPGIWSDVGAVLGVLFHALATSGLGCAPRSGFDGRMPNRFLVCLSDLAASSFAFCLFRYSDFTGDIWEDVDPF